MELLGKKINIEPFVDQFLHEDGDIIQLSGKIGNGKTYRATMLAIEYLKQGYSVYTNWEIDFSGISFDERQGFWHILDHFVWFKKHFYKFDVAKNWHYYDLDWGKEMQEQYPECKDIVQFVSTRTDCIFFADEGQDLFDSYEGTAMSKARRKSITRTRHLSKTLYVISQRPQAVAVTARANVSYFDKVVLGWMLPFVGKKFKVYRTEEVDSQNMPVWDMETDLYETYISRKEIYNAYNSWYLRKGIKKSQEMIFEVYELSFKDRWILLKNAFFSLFARLKPSKKGVLELKKQAEQSKLPF